MRRIPTTYELALWAALPMVHSSRIEKRLKGILDTTRRRVLARPFVTTIIVLAAGLSLAIATAYTPPRSLMAAITFSGYPSDTSAHMKANISLLQGAIRRFGDNDPWAGKAYYVLGSNQMNAGQYQAALVSFNRCLELPEPPYRKSGIHLSAEYERINDLATAGRYQEALTAAKSFLQTAPQETDRAFYRANIRARLTDFQMLSNMNSNEIAEKGQYRALTADPRWTQSLPNGVTVQLLGVMQSQEKIHTVRSPDGRLLNRALYHSNLDEAYAPRDPLQHVGLILHFSYPAGQALTASYTLLEAKSIAYQSGFARSNGAVLTEEEKINPATEGLRIIDAWFLPTERQATLRVGVNVGLPSDSLEQQGEEGREWAEFSNLKIPERHSP